MFCPLVVGPERIPVVTEEAEAEASPELGVLSVMAHGKDDVETAVRMAMVAEKACSTLPDALLYADVIRRSLSRAAQRLLEERMAPIEGYQYGSEFALKHRAEGKAEGSPRARPTA